MHGQPRYNASVCTRCYAPVADGQKVCDCGKATANMSFKERTEFELEQWRAYKSRSTQ
jgi:hypothetical protein